MAEFTEFNSGRCQSYMPTIHYYYTPMAMDIPMYYCPYFLGGEARGVFPTCFNEAFNNAYPRPISFFAIKIQLEPQF